jgi:hypothetical protein
VNLLDSPAEDAQPLLSAEDLELWAMPQQALVRSGTLSVSCKRLVCVGQARALVQAAVDSTRIQSGSLLFLGQSAEELLSSGRAGYCPRVLPAPLEFSVENALIGSARLIGLGPREVKRALNRSEAEGLSKRHLKDLGPLEHRLVGMAHGLSSDPELVMLDDPFEGLDDDAAELLLTVIERECSGRSWILGTDLRSPWSRRMSQAGELALSVEGGTLFGPVAPTELTSPGAWARFDRVSDERVASLAARGAEIVRTPSQSVLLVRRLGGLAIADTAAGLGCSLLELTPLMPGD